MMLIENKSILKSPLSLSSLFVVCHPSINHIFLRGNNSALGGHRVLPKVANERSCNIVLIFGVIWGEWA